ncbi:MAG: hypothetical protein WA869_08005, partial [Alloacidobacterium sp.]
SGQADMYDAEQQSEQTGKLDANGKLTISVPTKFDASSKRHDDQDYTIEAGVTDAANREITGRGRFLATYGSFRIHVEPVSYAERASESGTFRVTAVDYDNKPVQTTVHLQIVYRRWSNGKTETTNGGAADVTTDLRGVGQATIAVPTAGTAEVEASATTPEKRLVQDSTYLWVMGGGDASWFGGASQNVQIVADKKSYAPGDTAHLSIISQVDHFHALVVAPGYSIEFRKVLSSDGKTLSFDFADHDGFAAEPRRECRLRRERPDVPGQQADQGSPGPGATAG